jgi:fructokinase
VAKEANVRVFFDMDVTPRFFAQMNLGKQEELCDALKLVDVLKPCKAAAREMTGVTDYNRMADQLLNLGPKLVAITEGEDGCLIATKEKRVQVPAFRVNVVDTTGAGDAFMGGLSYGLLQDWDLERVGIFANACAALCCMKVGARAMSKLDEVLAFVKAKVPTGASAF